MEPPCPPKSETNTAVQYLLGLAALCDGTVAIKNELGVDAPLNFEQSGVTHWPAQAAKGSKIDTKRAKVARETAGKGGFRTRIQKAQAFFSVSMPAWLALFIDIFCYGFNLVFIL